MSLGYAGIEYIPAPFAAGPVSLGFLGAEPSRGDATGLGREAGASEGPSSNAAAAPRNPKVSQVSHQSKQCPLCQ